MEESRQPRRGRRRRVGIFNCHILSLKMLTRGSFRCTEVENEILGCVLERENHVRKIYESLDTKPNSHKVSYSSIFL